MRKAEFDLEFDEIDNLNTLLTHGPGRTVA